MCKAVPQEAAVFLPFIVKKYKKCCGKWRQVKHNSIVSGRRGREKGVTMLL
jgi:hypothetical protein